MRKSALKLVLAATVVTLGTPLALTSSAVAQQEIQLTVAAGQPLRAMRPLQMVEDFFIPEVDKRIKAAGLDKKYKINWKTAWAGSLLKPTQVLEGTRDGITDIGFEPTIFHPDKLPLEQISFVTPFTTSNVVQVGKAIDTLHASIPEYKAQYDKFNVVRLAGSSYDSYELFSTFPVKKLEDVKGKKIATAGAALQWLRGTAATPVQSNMTLYYNNAKTGVIDGFIIFPSSIPGMKYPEAAPYVTKVGFGAQYAAALIINKGVYDKLPPELRKILHEAGQAWTASADKVMLELGDAGFKSVSGFSGGQAFELPRDEQAKWAAAMPNIAREWADGMDKQKLPGSKALTAYMAEMRKIGAKPIRDWDKN
ncbi:MAG TPA: C4-dicarboxylate TRAP transporter substrate-binding protein [Xanthobacteraceae bacterium]|jgi:TRAP-type C4-dicarboxylate transport system substrate-binding protein